MGRNSCETKLRYRTGCKVSDSAKPCTRDLMMFMVFPKQRHEHVHVEQKSHALKASISLTSWEVIVPFVVRITGKPSSPVAIVKGSTFISGTTTNTFV